MTKTILFDLSTTISIANTFVEELRNKTVQQDSMRFRRNMERIGEYFAYKISETLPFETVSIETPLGIADCQSLVGQPVLATILRAGLPLQQGFLNIFDKAPCCFIAAFRKVEKSGKFNIQMDYITTPDLNDRVVIISDPMLATGQSMVICCKELLKRFTIQKLHIVAAIASQEGINYVQKHLPEASLWVGAIDDEMTTKAYIVPGLGDAGDLAYGEKL